MNNNKDKISLRDELIQNAKEYNESLPLDKANMDELILVDDIVRRMKLLSTKGKLACTYAVGRSTGYNTRKIRMDVVKDILENDPYNIHVDIVTPNSTTEIYMLHIYVYNSIIDNE